eukprot:gene10784-19581_t
MSILWYGAFIAIEWFEGAAVEAGGCERASGGTPVIFSMGNRCSEIRSEGPKKELSDFRASIQFVSNENDTFKSTIKGSEETIKKLSRKLEVVEVDMYNTVEDMLDKQEYMENQSRRNNLILIGFPEAPSELPWDDTENTVKALIKSEIGIVDEIHI